VDEEDEEEEDDAKGDVDVDADDRGRLDLGFEPGLGAATARYSSNQ
jgi:hypothetical protein